MSEHSATIVIARPAGPARTRRPGSTPERPAAEVRLRSQVSSRGRIVMVSHSPSSSSTWAIASPQATIQAPRAAVMAASAKARGRCPPPGDGRGRPAWRARPPRRAGGRSTGSSGRAPAGGTHPGRPRPSLNARNRRSGSGHRGTARCPGRRHRGSGRGTPFVRQQGKLADLGSGGYGGQAQRDGRAGEGVLAPGHGVRPGRGPEAGIPGPAHAPRVHRSQCPAKETRSARTRERPRVSSEPAERGARAEILHQQDARRRRRRPPAAGRPVRASRSGTHGWPARPRRCPCLPAFSSPQNGPWPDAAGPRDLRSQIGSAARTDVPGPRARPSSASAARVPAADKAGEVATTAFSPARPGDREGLTRTAHGQVRRQHALPGQAAAAVLLPVLAGVLRRTRSRRTS